MTRRTIVAATMLAGIWLLAGCNKGDDKGDEDKKKGEKVEKPEKGEEPEKSEEPEKGGEAPDKKTDGDKPEKKAKEDTPEKKKAEPEKKQSEFRLTKRAQAKVHFVWYRGPDGPQATGGATEMTVRVEPNESGEPAVGVIEQYMDGLGSQWRSASWMAAFNATAALGIPLGAYEFQVRTGGFVDGPSAGMLTTATMLALLTGATPLDNTTMTGTINPDGSAGPVGGIPQKILGAKAKGKVRFGFPIGSRNSKDKRTGRIVDLVSFGKNEGVEVTEIKDLADAYHFLTGKKLPQAEEVSESELELTEDVRARLNAHVAGWKAEIQAAVPALKQNLASLPKQLQQSMGAQLENLRKREASAIRHEQSGQITAAYAYYAQTAVLLEMTKNQAIFMKNMMAGNLPAIFTQLNTLRAVKGRLEALSMELQVRAKKKTIGGQVNGVLGFTGAVQAFAFAQLGDEAYALGSEIIKQMKAGKLKGPQMLRTAMVKLATPLALYSAADALIKVARQQMSIAEDEGDQPAMDLKEVGKLAKGYGSAASASLAYFDSLITEQIAKTDRTSKADAKAKVANIEFSYGLVQKTVVLAQVADRIFGKDKPEANLVRLAAGAYSYITAGGLVNKWYALSAQRNPDGSITLQKRKALTYQLDLARKRARQAAGRVKAKLGFVPSAARTSYQLALAMREGNDEDKLTALEEFWQATFWCDLAVMLSVK